MKLSKNSIVPQIWILTVLLYLGRSLAEPIKYLFFLSFTALAISYSLSIIKKHKTSNFPEFLIATKEYQILGFFLVLGIALSAQPQLLSVKSLVNYVGIAFFLWIYFIYREQIHLPRLYNGWIILTVIIGIIGLLKWLNNTFEFHPEWFSSINPHGVSLVSDYNFYAGYFLISIVIYFYLLYNEELQLRIITDQAILFLFIANIVLSGSRRGIVVLALLLIVTLFFRLLKRKKEPVLFLRKLTYTIILVLSPLLIIAAIIPFRSRIITENHTRESITESLSRYSTILDPNITYKVFYNKLWPKTAIYQNDNTNWDLYATYNNLINDSIRNCYQNLKEVFWESFEQEDNSGNLLYNGDFKHGLMFWKEFCKDSIKHEIIESKYGSSIRVSRQDGNGDWSLAYKGRDLIYHKGLTYTFRFKYRVVRGNGVPFHIGWWVNEGEGYQNDLPYKTRPLGDGWFEYIAAYKFKTTQKSLMTFMNSQRANTIIEFADIELTCDDKSIFPKFVDQTIPIDAVNLFYNSNFQNGLKFWNTVTEDTIHHELIETQYGKAVRVSRKTGQGYWPLNYNGREIFYYKGVTYYFRFKYRVVQGHGTPFNIGWWLPQEKPNPHNINKDIYPLNDQWYECIVAYTFRNDYYGKFPTFMNSQLPNTIIDFADIELVCRDTLNLPMYADQRIDYISALEEDKIKKATGAVNETLMHERTDRWKYALELWQAEYRWHEKLFGGGFDYLRKFGKKFYPNQERIDYPHNPIISAFLYSGLIGGLFYIYFLILSFCYYWKYRKHHVLFFILYVIMFVFVFISSDSHFNVPIFAMLSLVPFITKHIVKEKEAGDPA